MPDLQEAWIQGMLFAAILLGCAVFFCLLGILGAERASERRSTARIVLVLLMSLALVPVWPLVVVAGLGWGLVRLVKVADLAEWSAKRHA